MFAAVIAAAVVLASPPDTVGARIRQAEVAAQSLQGPLDGSWTLRDAGNRPLYVLQLVDPVDGGDLGGAWRDPAAGPGPHMGVLTRVRRTRAWLQFSIEAPAGATARIDLARDARGAWRGRLQSARRTLAVVMSR